MGIDVSLSNWSHLVISLHALKKNRFSQSQPWLNNIIYLQGGASKYISWYIYIYIIPCYKTTPLNTCILINSINLVNYVAPPCTNFAGSGSPLAPATPLTEGQPFFWRNLAKAGKGHQSFAELIRDWSILYTPRHPGLVSDLFVLGQPNDLDICSHWTLFFAIYANFRIVKQPNHVKTPCLMLMSPLFTRSRMGQYQFLLGKSLLNP